jgi:hypothetical protein
MKENNKLIAEFMGDYNFEHTEGGLPIGDFSNSWNWLMPVVDKIEDMGCEVVITNGECTISGNDYYVEIIGKNRRGATYNAVIEFINQYNKTK